MPHGFVGYFLPDLTAPLVKAYVVDVNKAVLLDYFVGYLGLGRCAFCVVENGFEFHFGEFVQRSEGAGDSRNVHITIDGHNEFFQFRCIVVLGNHIFKPVLRRVDKRSQRTAVGVIVVYVLNAGRCVSHEKRYAVLE